MSRHRSVYIVLVFILSTALSACGGTAPRLPATDEEMFQKLTGSDGAQFLQQISAHTWPDGGAAPADRLAWIKPDALSTDPARAQRAGEAAHTIALFLSDPEYGLADLPAGLFGLQRRSLGELNPNLVAAYAEALTPFQGALVGDVRKISGFEVVGDPLNLASAREIFSNIDTNTRAGAAFNNAAYDRVKQYLQAYAQSIANRDADDLVALQFAAGLAGVVEGGRRESANTALQVYPAQHFINLSRYEVAKALGAHPGENGIPTRFFTTEGQLKSPDAISQSDLSEFSTALENFAFKNGMSNLGTDFRRWYDVGAGV